MLTTLRAAQLFTRFLTALHRHGQLHSAVLSEVLGLSAEITQISERDDPDELLIIVQIMAHRGPVIITQLPSIPSEPAPTAPAQISDLLILFQTFLQGAHLTPRHLKQFVDMEADVLKIGRQWSSERIIHMVRLISRYGCPQVRQWLEAQRQHGE